MRNDVVISAFGALALDTRLRAYLLLADTGDSGLPAGEIARRLKVPQPTVSEHLKILAHAGIVTSERRSRSIIYRANTELVTDLIGFLSTSIGSRATAG